MDFFGSSENYVALCGASPRCKPQGVKPKRKKCALKEKQRNESINQAYKQLQKKIPHIESGSKIAKIKVLRLALKYIQHLNAQLEMPDSHFGSHNDDFAPVVTLELQAKNCYTQRASEEIQTHQCSASASPYSSPGHTDAGYGSQSHGTPNSSYSSDFCEAPFAVPFAAHAPNAFWTQPYSNNYFAAPANQTPSSLSVTTGFQEFPHTWNHSY